jgi:multidrug resistance protein
LIPNVHSFYLPLRVWPFTETILPSQVYITASKESNRLIHRSLAQKEAKHAFPEGNMNYGYPESSQNSTTGSETTLVEKYSPKWDILGNDGPHEKEKQPASIASSSSASVYTIFTDGQVRLIILIAAFAGSISPLSGTIYFPVVNELARDLQVSSSEINLTLTSYMILQGLSPMLFGDLADSIGRRPVFIIGFIIYVAACTGLALQDSYSALLVLRCLQSVGTSSTVAISVSVAADVSTHAERGKYMGQVFSGTALGTAIGPALGGVLSHFLGWRSVFWFLAILVGVYVVVLLLLFPETARNVVGNGSIQPQSMCCGFSYKFIHPQLFSVVMFADCLHRME